MGNYAVAQYRFLPDRYDPAQCLKRATSHAVCARRGGIYRPDSIIEKRSWIFRLVSSSDPLDSVRFLLMRGFHAGNLCSRACCGRGQNTSVFAAFVFLLAGGHGLWFCCRWKLSYLGCASCSQENQTGIHAQKGVSITCKTIFSNFVRRGSL